MRKLLIVWLLMSAGTCSVWAGPFQGQAARGAQGTGPKRKKVKDGPAPKMVNPVDFGAIPDDNKPDEQAFQRAIDALGSGVPAGQPTGGMVIVPPGTFDFAGPVYLDRDYTIFRGSEQNLTILRSLPEMNMPILIVGIRREHGKKKIGRGQFADAFGALDRIAVPKPETLWGIRPKGAAATYWDGALAFGKQDGYASTRVLTCEWAVAHPDGRELDQGSYMGMGTDSGPLPWCVGAMPDDSTYVWFRTTDQDSSKGVFWSFTFPAARRAMKGLRRRGFTIDLDQGKVSAWDNGVQVRCGDVMPMSHSHPKVASAPFRPGLKFARNDVYPFALGHVGPDAAGIGARTPRDSDWIFYGARVSSGAIYADRGPGNALRRLDDKPINDFSSYLAIEPTTLGMIRQDVDPMAVHNGIMLRAIDGPASEGKGLACGLYLPEGSQGGPGSSLAGPVIKNLSIRSRSGFGSPLMLGPSYSLHIEHVDIQHGWHGIGSYEIGPSWVSQFTDISCNFATDAGICLHNHLLIAQNIDIGYPGTTAMRLKGVGGSLEHLMIGQAPDHCEVLFKIASGQYGQTLAFRDVNYDGEGFWCPTVAAFWIENSNQIGPTAVDVEKLGMGRIGPDAVLIKLLSMGEKPIQKVARFSLRDCLFQSEKFRAIFEADGDRWHFDADHLIANEPLPPLLAAGSSPSRPLLKHLSTAENDARLTADRKFFNDVVKENARKQKEKERNQDKK